MYVFICSLHPKFTRSDIIAMLNEGEEDLFRSYLTRFKLASLPTELKRFCAVQKLDKEENTKS